ncbi:hypothetical protein AAFF_G00104880 [Aldrovandia affinis]|uniref:Uncharacterized protein n=1 Tax=Aldrovandia affinis TaxID=143900 RepID=A0AAD7T1Z6_9TELE|nr:hypothetical protein AAFF_G00104880 [Aldrovandia affinis]
MQDMCTDPQIDEPCAAHIHDRREDQRQQKDEKRTERLRMRAESLVKKAVAGRGGSCGLSSCDRATAHHVLTADGRHHSPSLRLLPDHPPTHSARDPAQQAPPPSLIVLTGLALPHHRLVLCRDAHHVRELLLKLHLCPATHRTPYASVHGAAEVVSFRPTVAPLDLRPSTRDSSCLGRKCVSCFTFAGLPGRPRYGLHSHPGCVRLLRLKTVGPFSLCATVTPLGAPGLH